MDSSFDNLLKLVKMDDQVTCNPEEGGCGKLNSIDQILSDPPHLFVVRKWLIVRNSLFFFSYTTEYYGNGF